MVMLVSDAREMIARNEKGLSALRGIAARMAEEGRLLDVSSHEAIVESQKEPSRFGTHYYYEGARDADFWETVSHEKEIFARHGRLIMTAALRSFADKKGIQ